MVAVVGPRCGRSWRGVTIPGSLTESEASAIVSDERSCIRCGICVDWCPTECPTVDHLRLTPPDSRESVDLAIVADG